MVLAGVFAEPRQELEEFFAPQVSLWNSTSRLCPDHTPEPPQGVPAATSSSRVQRA